MIHPVPIAFPSQGYGGVWSRHMPPFVPPTNVCAGNAVATATTVAERETGEVKVSSSNDVTHAHSYTDARTHAGYRRGGVRTPRRRRGKFSLGPGCVGLAPKGRSAREGQQSAAAASRRADTLHSLQPGGGGSNAPARSAVPPRRPPARLPCRILGESIALQFPPRPARRPPRHLLFLYLLCTLGDRIKNARSPSFHAAALLFEIPEKEGKKVNGKGID